jgi:3-hydroxyisobutyrate dehydrogenase-like beta-hydroxyacid dehydrogenase
MALRVGLIGVGLMGTALLSRLRLAGREVQAFDISADRMRIAREQGADPVASIAEAARGVDFVHVFVRTDDELAEVMTGKGGILSAARPGAIVFMHSTVMPETSRRIAAAARGLRVMDVPVTAVPRVVAAGNAVFLMGGADADAAVAVPYLQPLGKGVHHFGPVGSGNVAKIAKNLINANERVALSEVAAIAEAGGISVKQFFEMAASVDQGSTVSRWQSSFEVEGNHAAPRPASNLFNKDVGLAAELARALGLKTPMTQAAADTAAVWVAGWEKAGK